MDHSEEKFVEFGIRDFSSVIAVFDDMKHVICPTKEVAVSLKPSYIAQHTLGGLYPISSDTDRPKFSFEIFDTNQKIYNIHCGEWIVLNIEQFFYSGAWYSEILIKSPEGVPRLIKLSELSARYSLQARGLEEVIAVQLYLNTFLTFKDWEYYDLYEENESLKKQIASLTEELEYLRSHTGIEK